MGAHGDARALDHAGNHAELIVLLLTATLALRRDGLATIPCDADRAYQAHRHEQEHHARGEEPGKNAAGDGSSRIGDVAVEHHETVQACEPRLSPREVHRVGTRTRVDGTAAQAHHDSGEHKGWNRRWNDSHENAHGEHGEKRCESSLARTYAVDHRTGSRVRQRIAEVAHERDGCHEKGVSTELVGRRADEPKKIHGVDRAPLE